MRWAAGSAALAAFLACGEGSSGPDGTGNHVPYDASVENLPDALPMGTLEPRNGDTVRFDISYVAKTIEGRKVRMLAYNGSVPGPLLKVRQGDSIVLILENETDLRTSLHSHGLRLDHTEDGVPGPEGAPGAFGTHVYHLRFPDAGIYWYHPHAREDYQVELGLYGAYLVEPADPDFWPPVDREVVMIIDDLALDGNVIRAFYRDGPDHTMMGRFGNVFMVNGDPRWTLRVKRNETVRFYVVNASNSRVYNLQYSRDMDLNIVGADNGRLEFPHSRESYLVAPAERLIYQLYFNDALGDYDSLLLLNSTPTGAGVLGRFVYGPDTAKPDLGGSIQRVRCAQAGESIDPFRPYFDKSPDEEILLTGYMDMSKPLAKAAHDPDPLNTLGVEWSDSVHGPGMLAMNGMSNGENMHWAIRDLRTGKENHAIDWAFKRGSKVLIRVRNDTAASTEGPIMRHSMPHPIHFHGQRFLVVRENGKAPLEGLAWRDTYLIGRGYTVDLLLDASNPGAWMFHCHIAEHLENDMMGHFRVVDSLEGETSTYEWSLGLPWAGVDSLRRDTSLAAAVPHFFAGAVEKRPGPEVSPLPISEALDGSLYLAREDGPGETLTAAFDAEGVFSIPSDLVLGEGDIVRVKIWVRAGKEGIRPVPDTLRLVLDRRGRLPWSLELDLAGDTTFTGLNKDVEAVSAMAGAVSGRVIGFDAALERDTLYFRNMTYPEFFVDAPLASDGSFAFDGADLVGALDGLHDLRMFLRPGPGPRSFDPDTIRIRLSVP